MTVDEKMDCLPDHLRKLSSSRILSKKGLFAHQPNLTSTLFGCRKNELVTYSKSQPIQVMKKKHFHTPDTPNVLTPDEQNLTGENQDTETKKDRCSKTHTPASQGGSYASGKTLQSFGESSLQTARKLGTPSMSARHGSITMKSSSLALRNISNIPIEKTLSRTQCTPRNVVQRTLQDKNTPTSRKLLKRASLSCKRKKRTESMKKARESKKFSVEEKDQKYDHRKGTYKRTQKASTSSKTGSQQSDNVTNYSVKSMSTCTTATSSRGSTKQDHTPFTAQSMSLCHSTSVTDENVQQKPVTLESVMDQALLPKNSTFNESGEKVAMVEFFSDLLSPIKEGTVGQQTSQSTKPDKSLGTESLCHADRCEKVPSQILKMQRHNDSWASESQSLEYSNHDNGPRTSTPTDQAKVDAIPKVDVSPILETSDDGESAEKNEDSKAKQMQSKDKTSVSNSLSIRCSRNKSATLHRNVKPKNHKEKSSTQAQAQDLKENSKTSLPLQASICIEDDSDSETIQDNITPEIMETNKSCCSSSKRKLEYGGVLKRLDSNVCFLLDFKCTKKKPCKIWMRRDSPCVIKNKESEMCVPCDMLTIT